jgi:hypothetical protein
MSTPETALSGTLHIYVAFDWGDEVDLDQARRLAPATVHELPRRRRTPSSIAYRPSPLRFHLEPVWLNFLLDGVPREAPSEATVFDFAAVSVAVHVPFRLTPSALTRLAGWLAEPSALVSAARRTVEPLYRKLFPAIRDPQWREDLSEEYFVFQLPPGNPMPSGLTAEANAGWIANLIRLEEGPLSDEEIHEALRLHLRYTPSDLFVPDWAAAALFDADPDCNETLQVIEFANLQLLEYRHIDERLDANTSAAYRLAQRTRRRRLPLLGGYYQPLRALGELKVEANDLFERTGNVLKLVGDQYLARVYDLLAARFHLAEWEESIRRKLEVAEGVYQVVSDQAAAYRTEALEIIIIILIAVEIVMGLMRH